MKKVKDVMTETPTTCREETALADVAREMRDKDCGAIPVVDPDGKPIGVVTDRDIVVRALADGREPLRMTASQVMSSPIRTVGPAVPVEDCLRMMEEHRVRRIVVVDDGGRVCGIVAQADIARETSSDTTADLVKEVSEPALSR